MTDAEEGLIEYLKKEYMDLIRSEDWRSWNFALERSDEANLALQRLAMSMMRAAGSDLDKQKEGARAPALALWTLRARQNFLDVIEEHVAPLWAKEELPYRVGMFDEMREERDHPDFVS